jgi:hypothetical protein
MHFPPRERPQFTYNESRLAEESVVLNALQPGPGPLGRKPIDCFAALAAEVRFLPAARPFHSRSLMPKSNAERIQLYRRAGIQAQPKQLKGLPLLF